MRGRLYPLLLPRQLRPLLLQLLPLHRELLPLHCQLLLQLLHLLRLPAERSER